MIEYTVVCEACGPLITRVDYHAALEDRDRHERSYEGMRHVCRIETKESG